MRHLLCCLLVGGCLGMVRDAVAVSGEGTTAATFLKLGVGPRAVALGEAYAAAADDVSAAFWNPAGLARVTRPELSAMHVFWLEGITFDHLAGALPWGPGTAAVSVVYLNHGQLERADSGDTLDDPGRGWFQAADVGLTGAYAFAYGDHLWLGAGLELFSETIDAQSSLGWALDLGFQYQTPWPGLWAAAVVKHLGPATSLVGGYDRLPIQFTAGVAYLPAPAWVLTLDYRQELEQAGRVALGAEYGFEDLLFLRAGYTYQGRMDPGDLFSGAGGWSGFSAGVGVKYLDLGLDYAFVPYGLLGSTHRIAVTYHFPEPEQQESGIATRQR